MEKTVLVVDDIAANRNLLGETLESRDYEVLLASNGEMALKVAAKARPRVILMDVNMPDVDGYEACRRLKADAELAEIPVIFITANDDQESLVKGFEAGGVDYIAKPFKEKEVLMRVETHLRMHTLKAELEAKNDELENEVRLRSAAEEKANQANEAKSRFLSFISHEMRSPLNAIIGFSEELVDALEDDALADSREDATRIRSASEHLLGLINNLLDLSKIEAGKMPLNLEEFALGPLVTELGKDMEPLLRKRDNRLIVNEGGGGVMRSDPTKIKQVLMNLVSNAAKFTDHGEIRIDVRKTNGSEPPGFEIDVSDDGIGMSKEQQGRIFQAYEQASGTTSKRYGGTGLGLAISRQFCRLLGGDLSVASEPGSGSTFTVKLPARTADQAE